MLLYPLRWILTAVPLVPLCLADSAQPTTTVSLLDLMPKCASSCIENFIVSQYPKNACSNGCSLSYLCTVNTTSGYTLGEAALRCSLSSCSMEVALSFNTYSICDSVPGALPQTHATIVATVMSLVNPTSTTIAPTTVTTTQTETSDSSQTTTRTTTRTPTHSQTEHTSTTKTTFQTPLSVIGNTQDPSSTNTEQPTAPSTSSDSSPSATSSGSSGAASRGTGLDPGAVIGVSVASGVSGFFIFGAIMFFCCRKIRRKNQHARDRNFFEIGGVMSEPPDFEFPPKRPPLGPRPSPRIVNADSESARLAPLAEPEYQTPTLIVTEPDNGYAHSRMTTDSTDRMGFQSSSNHDFDVASSNSSRTVSDLLPDKPTYELYPPPLRWSQGKKPGRSSSETPFEETSIRPRNFRGPSTMTSTFSGSAGLPERSRGLNRKPVAGLPANPRAMLYGFGSGEHEILTMGQQDQRKKPIYANAKEKIQPSRQAAMFGNPSYRTADRHMRGQNGDFDNYWKPHDAGFTGAKVTPSHGTGRRSFNGAGSARNTFGDYLKQDFENIDINDASESRRLSRHSGNFRPLTPVREIKTPTGEPRTHTHNSRSAGNEAVIYPPAPYPPGPFNPPREIVSRPRIVRQDDIKRVQIRRGKPAAKDLSVPYCPDDYWLGHSYDRSSGYIPSRPPDDLESVSERMQGYMLKEKTAWERNLTPSRRGSDLILRVD